MGIAAGFGYGASLAANELAPAALRGRRAAEAHELQERQMDVNEAAQAASGAYYGAVTDTMQNNERRTQAQFTNVANAYDVLRGTPTPSTTTPGTPPTPAPLIPPNIQLGYVQPPGGGVAQPVPTPTAAPTAAPAAAPAAGAAAPEAPIAPVTPAPVDATQAAQTPASDGYGMQEESKNAMVLAEPSVSKGGPSGAVAKANARVIQTNGGPNGQGAASPDLGAGGKPVMGQVMATGKGQFTITPNEGSGYLEASKKLTQQATDVQARLDEGIKTIDSRYSNDSVMASYLKANLIASVSPQIATMNANAATMKNQGELANHMQVGASLSAAIIGRLNNNGIIDDKFIQQYKPMMEKLGVSETDLQLFHGMHLSNGSHPGDSSLNKGFVVNSGGFIIPPKALWDASNYALPFAQRAQAWSDMTAMYKDQMAAKAQMITAANTNPLLAIQYAGQQVQKLAEQSSGLMRLKDTAKAVLVAGGQLSVPGADGKPVMINVPKPTNGTTDSFDSYVSRYFARDKTLPKEVSQAVAHYLETSQGLDTVTTLLPLYSGFTTSKTGGGVHAGPNTNTQRFTAGERAANDASKATIVKKMNAIIDKGDSATTEEKASLQEWMNKLE